MNTTHQHGSSHQYRGTKLIGACVRLTRPPRSSVPWHAQINNIVGNDVSVMIIRPNSGHPETWNLNHLMLGLKADFYEFGKWGDA